MGAERTLTVKILGDSDSAQRAFKDLDGPTSGFGDKLKKLGLLGGAALAAIGGTGIKVAADFQQTTIAFNTMLGSGEKASVFLKDLRAFAAKTPFEFPELATAASSLISVGVESSKVIPIMTSLGNATAGMGTGSEGVKRATVALQQMSAAGRITGEDLNQLRDAGVPVFDLLAAATGKSKEEVAKLAQAGKLGKKEMEQLFKALEEGKGLERFNGLMEKQSATLNGVISTLKDTLSNIAIDFITPYLPAMTTAIQGFADLIQNRFVPSLHGLTKNVGIASSSLAEGFGNPDRKIKVGDWEDVFWRIGAAAGNVKINFEYITNVIQGDIKNGNWKGVGEALGFAISQGVAGAGAVAKDIGKVLSGLFGKVDWVGIGIAMGKQAPAFALGLVTGLLNFDIGALFRGVADHWLDVLVGLIALALTPARFLGPIARVLEKLPFGKTFAAVLFKTKDISEAALKFALHGVEALGNGLLRGIGFLGPKGVESMSGVVGSAIGVVRDSAGTLFKTTVEWMQKLPEGMLSVLDDIGRAIGTILRFIFDAYKDAATWLFSRGTELIGGLINGVKQESAFLFDYFLYIPRRIFELLSTIGSWLFEHGMMLIRGLKGGMDFSIVDVWQFYIELPGKILSWFSSAGTWLVRSGAQILEGLLSGTSSVWESAVWPWFRAVGGRIGEAVGNIGSALVGKGRDIVAGLFEGARSGWDTFAGWIGGLYGRVLGAAGNFGSILLEAGKDVIRSLIRGIDSMIGALGEKMRDVANKIGNYLPHSPAKEGPLSGKGYPLYAGQAIVRSLAAGISSEAATLDAAMAGMLRPVGGSPAALAMTGGANGGTVNHNYNINAPGAYAEPITEAGLALMLRRTELQKATYVA